jgi:shikimate 5-dehydrogenase
MAAREQGCRAANGLGMLLYQGALAFERWTGQPVPVRATGQALGLTSGDISLDKPGGIVNMST